ncbi:unnamed protein product, partial [Laminaria digitata]
MMLREQRIHVLEFERILENEQVFEVLDGQLERAGAQRLFVIASFPRLSSDKELVDWLLQLRARERWSVRVLSHDRDTAEIQVEWKTANGHWSNCMGLAPTLSMPPTRRAPYISFALWPGEQSRSSGEKITFRDIPDPDGLRGEPETRREMLHATREAKEALFEHTPDRNWRDISF